MLQLLLMLRLLAGPDAPLSVPLEHKMKLLEEINRDRALNGRAPVQYSEELSRAADEHCREMLLEDYMSHWNRAGWKPYLRYAAAGIRDATSENVWALWKVPFDRDSEQLLAHMLTGHRGFTAEKPPYDGHRQSILHERHTHVGIGVAYNATGMRLVELYGARYAEIEPVPLRAARRDRPVLKGRLLSPSLRLFGIATYYEPPPREMSRSELRATASYGLPEDEYMQRVQISDGIYVDGSTGTIQTDAIGRFIAPIVFWKNKPGVYTVVVWVRERSDNKAFQAAMTSIVVE